MRHSIFAAAAVCTLAFASPALAQGQAPVIGGGYIGPVVGYDMVELDDGVDSSSEDGLAYGGVIGYDFAVGNALFVGGEAEFTTSDAAFVTNDLIVPGDTFAIESGRDLYIGARLGMHLVGQTKVFVKAGYTTTRVTVSYDDGASLITSETENLDGVGVGAGLDVGVGPLALRAEYRFSQYGDLLDSGVDMTRHQIMAGTVGRF